jgi:hypothetical protein
LGQDEIGSSPSEPQPPAAQTVALHEEAPAAEVESHGVRLWVRVPTEGFLHVARWPLLAFLLLVAYAVFFFARGSVEGAVRERVRARLAGQWLGFATVEVSGQSVVLRGTPTATGDADRALLLAERTACPTLFGSLDCTLDVRGEFEVAKPSPPVTRPAAK